MALGLRRRTKGCFRASDNITANGWAFAGVVCRQIGHATGTPTTSSQFGAIFPVSFWLDDVVCDGTEANLGACAHAGWGTNNCSFSERAGVQCTVAASGLTATGGDGEVALAWDAPGDDAGITRHEYRYKWKTGDSDYTPWKVIPGSAAGGDNASSYTATKHVNLIDYVFQVRAVNAGGGSGPSNEAAATPLHPDAPPAPTVSAPAGTAGLLEVSWTEPTAGAYVVRYWPADEDGSTRRTRSTSDQNALVALVAGVSDCADVTTAHLAAITGELDLGNQDPKITALAAGDFDGLNSLTTLGLSGNALTTLPAGVFDDLTALNRLDPSHNTLTELPAGVFKKLTALRFLLLRYNDLTELPAGVFDGLTALSQLWLDRTALTELPEGMFVELTSLNLGDRSANGHQDRSGLPLGGGRRRTVALHAVARPTPRQPPIAKPAEHEVAASAAVNVTAVNDPATGAPMAGRVRHLLPLWAVRVDDKWSCYWSRDDY